MGVDYKVYVGPYIVVHNPPQDSMEEYHSCPNEKCSLHKISVSNGFCPKCGTTIGTLVRPCQKRIEFEWWEEFDGRLSEAFPEYKPDGGDDNQYFIPNMDNDVGIHLDAKYSGSENVINTKTLTSDNKRFIDGKKKEIRKLKKVFGKNNVTVKWGVLCWQS
jgi:hypothetical protein